MSPLDTPNLPQWKKDWLEANCIFVELDHRIYMDPTAVVPEIFHPRPYRASLSPAWDEEELDNAMMPPPDETPVRREPRVRIDENSVYLEDLYAPAEL